MNLFNVVVAPIVTPVHAHGGQVSDVTIVVIIAATLLLCALAFFLMDYFMEYKDFILYAVMLVMCLFISFLGFSNYSKPHEGQRPTDNDFFAGRAIIDTTTIIQIHGNDTITTKEYRYIWND